MLYTFPGSGNTWSRLLIEYSTGILTGSVYNDRSLLEELPGEFTCSWTVSAVKVHPHTHPFEPLRSGGFGSDDNKCNRGGVKRFERAVLLIRDPYDSIWSEYQRRLTQSHVSGVFKAGFDWHRWQANAASLANMYHEMWAVQHTGIQRHFKPEDYIFVSYERLKDRATRTGELARILAFLRIQPQQQVTQEQLECAFVLAESKRAHRTASTLALRPTGEGLPLAGPPSADPQLFMTKPLAYTRPLVCRMWALFGRFAAQHGYRPYNGYNCTTPTQNWQPIPRINVGPQGEYNRKWVSPGEKLLDWGGYNASEYAAPPGSNPNNNNNGMKRRRRRPGAGRVGGMGLKQAGDSSLSATNGANGGKGKAVGEDRAAWKE